MGARRNLALYYKVVLSWGAFLRSFTAPSPILITDDKWKTGDNFLFGENLNPGVFWITSESQTTCFGAHSWKILTTGGERLGDETSGRCSMQSVMRTNAYPTLSVRWRGRLPTTDLDPVVRKLVKANPWLKFNQGFFFSCLTEPSQVILSGCLRTT